MHMMCGTLPGPKQYRWLKCLKEKSDALQKLVMILDFTDSKQDERFSWCQQGNETAKRLAQDDKEGKLPKAFYNHYTIISTSADGQYTQASYAASFPTEIGAIGSIFEDWIAGVQALFSKASCPRLGHSGWDIL